MAVLKAGTLREVLDSAGTASTMMSVNLHRITQYGTRYYESVEGFGGTLVREQWFECWDDVVRLYARVSKLRIWRASSTPASGDSGEQVTVWRY